MSLSAPTPEDALRYAATGLPAALLRYAAADPANLARAARAAGVTPGEAREFAAALAAGVDALAAGGTA